MTSEEKVKWVYPDAFVDEFECDEGCKHYRIFSRMALCMYEDTADSAWDSAWRNIQRTKREEGM